MYNKKKWFQDRYHKRKEQGLCTRCGNPAVTGKTLCEDCAEKSKKKHREDREFFKAQGLCPKCGKNKLIGSEKTCPECLAYAEEVNTRYAIKMAGSKEAYHKQAYQKARQHYDEQNLCVMCKKRQRAEGHIHCEDCLKIRRKKNREMRKQQSQNGLKRSERPAYGLCYTCGAKLDRDGRTCSKCAMKMTMNLPRIKNTDVWKRDNNLIFKGVGK